MQSSFLENNENPVEFLYLDRQRIASLIGQLSDKGQLTGLKSSASKTLLKEGGGDASIPGVAKIEGKRATTSAETLEETWDPFWTNAYSFLKDLEGNFAVPIEKARLGSMVKFEALIQFVDLGMMKNLWEPSVQVFLNSLNPAPEGPLTKRQKERRQQARQMTSEQKLFLQILKEVPHLFHLTFITKSGEGISHLWASVRPEHLTINSEDLTMKFGSVLDGLWQVVGIVDARAGEPAKPWPVNPVIDGVVSGLAAIREQVGRPKNHIGITPIAIYSPICGIAESEIAADSTDQQ